MSAFAVFVSVYGSISLGLAARGTERRKTVYLTLLLYCVATVVLVVACLIAVPIDWYIGGWGGPLGESVTILQWNWTVLSLEMFGPFFCALIICFLFRASVQKEIELSKSATSSTSSSSRSVSSGTSSGSSDPVIEL